MICFNTKYWPLVYFYIDNNRMTKNDFEEYKKTYLKILLKCKKENTKIILISDLNNQKKLSIKYMLKQAKFNLEIEQINKKYVQIACVLLNGKSFLLNLYFSISKPYCPYKICKSYDTVNSFIKEKTYNDYDSNVFSNLIQDISNLNNDENDYNIIKNMLIN
jgi:hypothetical protein